MATLASKLKLKMDQEKSKSPLKRTHDDSASCLSDESQNKGTEEKVKKLENDKREITEEDTVTDGNSSKLDVEQWKIEKEKLREKTLETDRVNIEKRMPEESKQEIRKLEQMCKTNKPPTPANFKIFTNDVLIDLLRYNDRSLQNASRKPELAAAVCDSMVNGTPPRCPKCKNSMLRFSCGKKRYGKRYYWCPGYMGGARFYSCGFKANRENVTRRPWVAPK